MPTLQLTAYAWTAVDGPEVTWLSGGSVIVANPPAATELRAAAIQSSGQWRRVKNWEAGERLGAIYCWPRRTWMDAAENASSSRTMYRIMHVRGFPAPIAIVHAAARRPTLLAMAGHGRGAAARSGEAPGSLVERKLDVCSDCDAN